jgi:hypothetical protein
LLNQGNEKIQCATTELNRFATLLEESLRSREAKRANQNGATHCRTIAIIHGIYSPEGVCPEAAIASARVHVNILDRFCMRSKQPRTMELEPFLFIAGQRKALTVSRTAL